MNSDLPHELTIQLGFLAIDYGPPLATTLFSLARIALILCIKLSPKADYETEADETLAL